MANHGPHAVSSQGQVKLPARLLRELRINAGDEFYWRTSDDDPGVLILIPAEVMERRYAAGAELEAVKREQATQFDFSVGPAAATERDPQGASDRSVDGGA